MDGTGTGAVSQSGVKKSPVGTNARCGVAPSAKRMLKSKVIWKRALAVWLAARKAMMVPDSASSPAASMAWFQGAPGGKSWVAVPLQAPSPPPVTTTVCPAVDEAPPQAAARMLASRKTGTGRRHMPARPPSAIARISHG
jgi:hypothetical protein